MNKIKKMVVLAIPFAAAACSSDPSTPATTEDQLKAVRGSKPTQDQLNEAVKNYKGLAGPPPGAPGGGGAPPMGDGKTAPPKK